ncbi:MAG: hypothetical protein HY752_04820 [Nitrospirae bacterium]|nr:hypothetical protein [Nitrospirota bacterium]
MDSLKDKIDEIERGGEIINALKECKWVMARAARKLGITESITERMIGYRIKKYGIEGRIKAVGSRQ